MSQGAEGAGGAGVEGAGAVLHARPFKLRFAPRREPGRSYLSPNKPLGLPDTVTCKWYTRAAAAAAGAGADAGGAQAEAAALERIERLCARAPRDVHERPFLSSHEYGWWSMTCELSRPEHGLCDSHWLKTRARLLHEEASLKPR